MPTQDQYKQIKQNLSAGSLTAPTSIPQEQAPRPQTQGTPPQGQLPFMAVGTTPKGEPYYAKLNGFSNWTRRTFARIFDPKFFVPAPTKDEQAFMDEQAQKITQQLKGYGWDKWVAPVLGIQAEEVGQAAGAMNTASVEVTPRSDKGYDANVGKTLGAVSGLAKRTVGQAFWSVLDVFGLGDQLMRKTIHPARLTLDQYADASTLPDLPAWMNIFSLPNDLYDEYRVINAIQTGRLNPREMLDTVQEKFLMNQRASNAIYTLMFNEQRKAEYYRRYQNGESPELLQKQLANPWIELGGSIIGDPMTYMGIALPAKGGKVFGIGATADDVLRDSRPIIRIGSKEFGRTAWSMKQITPSLGEVLNLSVGKTRLLNETKQEINLSADLEEAARALGRDQNSAEAVRSVRNLVDTAVNEAKDLVSAKKFDYGITSYKASDRARILARDASFYWQAAFSSGDMDEGFDILKSWDTLVTGTDEEKSAAILRLFNTSLGTLTLSPEAMRTAVLVSEGRRAGEVDKVFDGMQAYRRLQAGAELDTETKALAKWYEEIAGADGSKLPEFFVERLNKITEKLIPDVTSMHDAAVEVKRLTKLGETPSEGLQALADAYKKVPWYARGSNAFNETVGKKFFNRAQGFFNAVFINWGSPAYPMRNVFQQGVVAALDGIPYNHTVEASINMWSNKATESYLAAKYDELKNILGHVPEGAMRGTTGAAESAKFGFGRVSSNADQMQGAAIISHTVQKEIINALKNGGIPEVRVLSEAGFSRDDIALIYKLTLDNYGWGNRVEKQLRTAMRTGQMDAWRYVDMNAELRSDLRDNDLLGKVDNLRLNAQTQSEFNEGIERLIAQNRARATTAAQDAAVVSPDLPGFAQDAVAHAQQHANEFLSDDAANLYTRMMQSRGELSDAVMERGQFISNEISANLTAESRAAMSAEMSQALTVKNHAFEPYRNFQDFITGLNKQLNKGEITLQEAWGTALRDSQGRTIWSLQTAYPEAALPTDPKEIKRLLWESYYETSGRIWDNANRNLLNETTEILNRYATEAGMDWTEMITRTRPGQINNFQELDRIVREGDELSALWTQARKYRVEDFPRNASLYHLWFSDSDRFGQSQGAVRLTVFEEVNKRRRLEGYPPYAHMDEVPIKEAVNTWNRLSPTQKMQAIQSALHDIDAVQEEHALQNALTQAEGTVDEGMAQIETHLNTNPPPYVRGQQVTPGQGVRQSADMFERNLRSYANEVSSRWGEVATVSSRMTPEMETAFKTWRGTLDERSAFIRMKSEVYGNKLRDFILHDYMKTYGDMAAGFMLPYQYWYNRTYQKFIERIIYDPRIASLYMKYRNFMAAEHAGLPEWWKYNVPITFLPGTSADNPLFFNLEATLNPLNGLTGVDFDDPYKRVDWLSSTLDDLNKFGPSLFTPIQWAVALHLYNKGETDAAQRWVGKLFPQTTTIKAALNIPIAGKTGVEWLGLNKSNLPGIRYGDFDPFVNAFMNGQDPYEQTRTTRALATMIQDGTITSEVGIDAANSGKGEVWDAATQRALQGRAPGQLFSFFTGVGFKPRTKEDMAIDQFYQEYSQLLGLRETMSPDEYKRSWDNLREKFPFMDTVLIGKKQTADKLSAYSYNVLSRIPPGQMTDLVEVAGINQEMVNKFYDGKGTFDGWTEADKKRWEAGLVDIGAMLKMPEFPIRQEWTNAKLAYADMQDTAKQIYGDTIYDKLDEYYNLDSGNPRRQYLEAHPELKDLLQWTDAYVANNPLLSKYYGGLDTIDRYYSNLMYADLYKKYGSDIGEKWAYYAELKTTNAREASRYYRQHPELKAYSTDKAQWAEVINRAYIQLASHFPEQPYSIRSDFTPQSQYQQELLAATQPEPVIPWSTWQQNLPSYLTDIVYAYWIGGAQLSYNARDELDYQAQQLGYRDGDELLRAMGRSLVNP